ncbi:tripartite tricarboxylate transporter substrate binding protein [Roseomonas alkaliterrae]|uniref:Tripartite-type tricarboxylate transporter receptor subunit TctC n=1 Tax=Neoroseomonas alkaliterrae TaxID=1452450 RepID=A0A840XYK0_9PROT|nr:tripartite tricarboxylate transporter substrate binding protein [Neoroseomonas alkaliterrae]MBB5691689.1 tripartite-type tricarboxylate transporter receptor subunit TctC [Neoroseomonas alkaliterrae]MBR0676413.1 tripartite tricarboxylate transporter substrate binding protein [Neoroseomonas alkaliterrae]
MPAPSLGRRAALLGAASLLATPALAQRGWPAGRPIEIVVPFAPGGGMDAMARTVAPFLAAKLSGARVVVSNRPGAGGQLGTEAVANAAPDGFVLGACATPTVLSQPIERPVRWRPAELTYLAQVVEDPCGLFVRADSPLKSLPDLLAAARARPGDLSYGTAGIGGDDHIATLLLEEAAKVRLNHVPFNGTSQLLVPLLGGQLEVGAFNISEALPLLRDRAIRGLALASEARDPTAPDIATYREGGVDVVFSAGRGIFGPPGLPDAIRIAIEEAFAAIFADPAWTEAASRAGLPLKPLVGTAYRDAALGGEAALRALWSRRPWKE